MFTVVFEEKTQKEKINILSDYFCFSSPSISIYQYYSYEGLNKNEEKKLCFSIQLESQRTI